MGASNVLVYSGDEPHYELTGDEVIYRVRVSVSPEMYALFHMDAGIPAFEFKRFIGDMGLRYKAADLGDEREIQVGDETECHRFIDAHFRRMSALDGDYSIEEQKAYLNENPGLKSEVFEEGYNKVVPDMDEAGPRKLRLVLGSQGTRSVSYRRPIYSPERELIELVRIKQNIRDLTTEDRLKHKRAGKIVEKGRFQIIRQNFDVVEQLYQDIVTSAEGVLMEGAACTEASKPSWVPRMPFLDKLYTVNRAFARTAVKNA